MPTVTLKLDPAAVVVVTDDYGIATGGRCNACDESGYLEGGNNSARYGYPFGAKKRLGNELYHAEGCPMNAVLREDGTLKGSRRKKPKKKTRTKLPRKKRP